jgi:MORN repeat
MEVDRKEGSFYIGEWRYDEKEGYGRLVLETGNIYDGNWVNSVAHGKGNLFLTLQQANVYFRKIL